MFTVKNISIKLPNGYLNGEQAHLEIMCCNIAFWNWFLNKSWVVIFWNKLSVLCHDTKQSSNFPVSRRDKSVKFFQFLCQFASYDFSFAIFSGHFVLVSDLPTKFCMISCNLTNGSILQFNEITNSWRIFSKISTRHEHTHRKKIID